MERREKFKYRYEMYNDNYRSQAEAKLGAIYKAFAELKLDVQLNDNNNLYKQVVNSISNVYSFGVNREFNDDKTKELYELMRIDKVMTQANKYMNAFNDLLIQVVWNDINKRPELILRLPHATEVEYNNNNVSSVQYYVGTVGEDNDTERWAYWSNESHYYIDKYDGEETKVPINGASLNKDAEWGNPLGIMPFIYLHNGWRDYEFWDTYTGDDLTGGTIDLSIYLTFLNHIIKAQSFKQLVVSGSNVQELIGQVSDPQSVLHIDGQDTKIDVLDMQSDFGELHNVIQSLTNNIAINYGISPNQFRMTSQATSGFALQMENLKLDRFTVEQQQDFKVYEQDLFDVIKIVAEYYDYDISAKDDNTINIDFVEPNYPTSEADKLDIYTKEINLGLTSPQNILMSKNPNLDFETATKQVKDNLSASTIITDEQ